MQDDDSVLLSRGDVPIVRRALVADAPAIARIHVDAWRVAYEGLLPKEILDALSVEARETQWREWLDPPTAAGKRVSVGAIDGRVAGFLAAGATRDEDLDATTTAEIHSVYVDPAAWGRGVGQALVREALADLAQARWRDVVLWSLVGNERAARFYRAAGFVEQTRRPKTVRGYEPMHVLWRMELAGG